MTADLRRLVKKLWRCSKYLSLYTRQKISNCVFNFNILALVVSEILGGPKFTLGGPFVRPIAEYIRDIMGVPKFTLGGPTPPGRNLAEKFLYPKRILCNI